MAFHQFRFLGNPCVFGSMSSILNEVVLFSGSSPVDSVSQAESEASVKQIANMKEQIENYRSIISKQEQLLQVCFLCFNSESKYVAIGFVFCKQ